MNYRLDHIAASLKAAREQKGLTQRQLKDLAGLPQGHISRIENGDVDLKLSTLIELGRILDLEVMLVPRAKVPAVQTIATTATAKAPDAADRKRIQRLFSEIAALDLKSASTALFNSENGVLSESGRKEIDRLIEILGNAKLGADKSNTGRLEEQLRTIRNRLAHTARPDEPPRPAYTLDEEDDDA